MTNLVRNVLASAVGGMAGLFILNRIDNHGWNFFNWHAVEDEQDNLGFLFSEASNGTHRFRCEGCGEKKLGGQAFCSNCFSSLPQSWRRELGRKFNEDYARIWNRSRDVLNARASIRRTTIMELYDKGLIDTLPRGEVSPVKDRLNHYKEHQQAKRGDVALHDVHPKREVKEQRAA